MTPEPVTRNRRRVAIVGADRWGYNWTRAVERSPRWELAAVVDLDDHALDRAVRRLRVDEAICYKHFDEAIEETQLDAAIISVPCPRREGDFKAACGAGLHCLVEKPAAESLEQINRYLDWTREAGNTVMVAHNYRFADITQRICDAIKGGEHGALNYLHVTVDRHMDLEGRFYEASPHAALMESGTQAFDLLRKFVNDEPVRIVARSGNPPASQFKNEPCAAAILEFANGQMATVWVSWTAAENATTWYGTWDLFFEGATLRTDGRSLRLIRGGTSTEMVPARPVVRLHLGALLNHFADALDAGVVPECDLEENVGTVAIALAAVESAKSGAMVDITDYLQRRIR